MRTDKTEKQIAIEFEYNIYIWGFMKDNSDKLLQEAIYSWKVKKSKSEDNKYTKADI